MQTYINYRLGFRLQNYKSASYEESEGIFKYILSLCFLLSIRLSIHDFLTLICLPILTTSVRRDIGIPVSQHRRRRLYNDTQTDL